MSEITYETILESLNKPKNSVNSNIIKEYLSIIDGLEDSTIEDRREAQILAYINEITKSCIDN